MPRSNKKVEALEEIEKAVGLDQDFLRRLAAEIREGAEIVRETVPGCEVEYAGEGNPDPRNYRVDFTKITQTLPAFEPRWDARRGTQELHSMFKRFGLTLEDFQGRRYIRLAQLKHLIETEQIDSTLRWRSAESQGQG